MAQFSRASSFAGTITDTYYFIAECAFNIMVLKRVGAVLKLTALPSVKIEPTVIAEKEPSRYQTRPAAEGHERVVAPASAPVRPRNENPKMLFAKPPPQERQQQKRVETTTQAEIVHEVKVTAASTGSEKEELDPRVKILQQLGGQLNSRMSPDLLSKIEKLLSDELDAKQVQESTSGFASETSALHSRTAPVPSTSLVRQFTSRVQKADEKM